MRAHRQNRKSENDSLSLEGIEISDGIVAPPARTVEVEGRRRSGIANNVISVLHMSNMFTVDGSTPVTNSLIRNIFITFHNNFITLSW